MDNKELTEPGLADTQEEVLLDELSEEQRANPVEGIDPEIVDRENATLQKEVTHNEQISETAKLAAYLESISDSSEFTGVDAIHQLTGYFKIKQKSLDLYQFAPPEVIAGEIWKIEERVRDIAGKTKLEAVRSIREGLLAAILSGKVSAEVILARLNGQIIISEKPGEEIGKYKDHEDPANIAAFFTIKDGVSNVYLYQGFMNENPAIQQHHIQHEMGHLFAETGSIWPREQFLEFLDAVSTMDDSAIERITPEAPELASIYRMIKNPQEAVFFRDYIQRKLKEISTLPDAKKPQARVIAAKEIIAEMTAFYLGSADDELSYFNARLAMVGKDKVDLIKSILSPERLEAFNAQHDIEQMTTQDVYDFIRSAPEFQLDFQMQQQFLAKMNQVFEQRGQDIRPMSETMQSDQHILYADGYLDDWDTIPPPSSNAGLGQPLSTGGQAKSEEVFTKMWDFITGNKKVSST